MVIKTVNKVIEKALEKGFANVNGRMAQGWGYYGELESKYRATYENGILCLEHWGTEILNVDVIGKTVIAYYMESKSDRDAIVSTLDLLKVPYNKVSYRPSIGAGEIA